MGKQIVVVNPGTHDLVFYFFFHYFISLLHFPIHLLMKGYFSFHFPSFSNDKNWRPLAASYRELHTVDDSWAAEKGPCVNTLAFIGPQRDEGPGSGPCPTCY